jgi:Leucine-rich repeat (LRR) protein
MGSMPEELSALSDLTVLDLSNNRITGAIPTMKYVGLKYLNLASNSLVGSLHPSIAALTSLTSLYVGDNSLTSTLPESLALLSNLQVFHFGQNQIVGTIPEAVSNLSLLQELNTTRNRLSGSIGFIQHLTQVVHLDLSYNQFEHTIPEGIGRLKALRNVDLSENHLIGTLPSSIGTLNALELLQGSGNSLSGTFPWSSFTENTRLTTLSMANNKLSGSLPLPLQLSKFDATLEVVELSGNHLSGKLPNWSFKSLKELRLSRNGLTGTLPEFGLMASISLMDFSANALSNTIPSTWQNFASLEWLGLDGNILSGPVPTELSRLPKLGKLQYVLL